MLNEVDIVRDVSRRFDEAGIAYMLTGSMAMNYYAEPRMTRDIDIVVALSADQADRIVSLFTPDYYIASEAVVASIAKASVFNLIHQESIIKVDCIVRKPSEFRRIEFDRRRQITLGDFPTWIVSKEDLILSKLDWAKDSHSEVQLRDVRNLLNGEYDAAYVESWTPRLGVHTLYEECLHE